MWLDEEKKARRGLGSGLGTILTLKEKGNERNFPKEKSSEREEETKTKL